MTNADSRNLSIDTTNFYQVDLPRLILSGADIFHNATFFSDTIKEDKNKYIQKNLNSISSINASSIIRKQTISSGISVFLEGEQLIGTINNLDTIFLLHKDTIGSNHIILTLDDKLKILSEEKAVNRKLLFNYFYQKNNNTYINIYVKNEEIYIEWIKDNIAKYTARNTKAVTLNSKDIIQLLDN